MSEEKKKYLFTDAPLTNYAKKKIKSKINNSEVNAICDILLFINLLY